MDKFIADKSVDPIMAATRAMVVCEQAYTRRLVADVLYGMGIGAVALFDQPKRALESMAQFRPTLLVANWDAPSQDGLDLAKLVRSAAKSPTIRIPDPTIPIILVGCQQWLRDVNEAERAGVNEYLVKPFSIEDLTRRVTHLLLKPKPFIVSATYVGPDRRIKNQPMPVERRIEDDLHDRLVNVQPVGPLAEFRAGLAQRLDALRACLPTQEPIAPDGCEGLQQALQVLEHDARAAGDEVTRRIAQSLALYIAGAGNLFQAEIAQAHLAAMAEFQNLPPADRDTARSRLSQLDKRVRAAPMQFPDEALGHKRAS